MTIETGFLPKDLADFESARYVTATCLDMLIEESEPKTFQRQVNQLPLRIREILQIVGIDPSKETPVTCQLYFEQEEDPTAVDFWTSYRMSDSRFDLSWESEVTNKITGLSLRPLSGLESNPYRHFLGFRLFDREYKGIISPDVTNRLASLSKHPAAAIWELNLLRDLTSLFANIPESGVGQENIPPPQ